MSDHDELRDVWCLHCGHTLPHVGTGYRETFRCTEFERIYDRGRAEGVAAAAAAVGALAARWDGFGHGYYNTHLEVQLPCSACDLLAQLRAALADLEET